MADASEDPDAQITRQQLIERHRHLAQFVTEINITADLDEILRQITEVARELVGAHQSVTSRTLNQNWEQAINAVSLSEKYAEYSDYDTEPDGSGIYSVVCERNEPMRVTQDELESHPAWQAFGDEADEHPPMDGWLAVPIVGPEGENTGLIQLSDRYDGEFTEADEAILVQLANVASAAIENARLYDELRESEERYRTLFDSMTEGTASSNPRSPTTPTEPTIGSWRPTRRSRRTPGCVTWPVVPSARPTSPTLGRGSTSWTASPTRRTAVPSSANSRCAAASCSARRSPSAARRAGRSG
ncbi:GAF domain-containing protein [Halosimplex aquaticum]